VSLLEDTCVGVLRSGGVSAEGVRPVSSKGVSIKSVSAESVRPVSSKGVSAEGVSAEGVRPVSSKGVSAEGVRRVSSEGVLNLVGSASEDEC
jgi:hypothetical protein